MIRTFASKETQALWLTGKARRLPPDILRRAMDSLQMLDAVTAVEQLKVPPSNRLEALKGDRRGFFSIRVNNQWRVVFRFEGGDAFEVAIIDYH